MIISQSDLDSFHHFATNELAKIGREVSIEELLRRWQSRQEYADTMASIRRGVADAEAGRLQDLDDVDAKIRRELDFPTRAQ